jgi:hypothetical protein
MQARIYWTKTGQKFGLSEHFHMFPNTRKKEWAKQYILI